MHLENIDKPKNRASDKLRNRQVKGTVIDLSSPIFRETQESAVVSLISNERSCKNIRRSTSVISMERALNTKRKREEDEAYDTTLATALTRFDSIIG